MTDFTWYTPDNAPEGAKETLKQVSRTMGFVPRIFAGMAEAPAALEAYMALDAVFGKTSFSDLERKVIQLAASEENECGFCVAAHSTEARQQLKAPDHIVNALRQRQELDDAKLNALTNFTRQMVSKRGFVSDADVDEFLQAGYNRQQVLEVIIGVSLKTLSNYSNHVMETPLNDELAPEKWERKE